VAAKHRFQVIDSHTGGNPTRLVLSGVPELPGRTVSEKTAHFRDHHDWIRTAMVLELRGGNLTSSAVLVPPCDPRADIGVFVMEPFGYPPMRGSDTVGLITKLDRVWPDSRARGRHNGAHRHTSGRPQRASPTASSKT
jgi:proline racemase